MGQRVLIKSVSGTSNGTIASSGVSNIPVATLPSDPNYIWEVSLSVSLLLSSSGSASISSNACTGITYSTYSTISFSTSTANISSSVVGIPNTVRLGPGSEINVTMAIDSSSGGSYEISWSAIGKKVIDESF